MCLGTWMLYVVYKVRCLSSRRGKLLPYVRKKQIPQKRKPLKRPNGSGTVYKLSGHRKRPWVAAKNKVIIRYYEKKTDALQALERLSGVSLSDRFNMTFAEVYAQWSPEHFKTIGPKGVEAYENSFQIFFFPSRYQIP